MHCHTCYSYNGYGFTPAEIAYLARKSGWLAAGIIDFDVLDAVDEFRSCAEQLDIISYGKERPAVEGTGEAVWAKNRRDEFNVIAR